MIDLDTALKALAVAIYCGVLLFLGWAASKRMASIRDYFAGGKRLGFINVAFSSRATGESAWLLLGLTGSGFAFGVQAFWIVFGEVLGVALAWLFMAKRFKRLTNRYDSLTVPDYLESRFRDASHMLRLIAAGALLVFVPIYAGSQVFATGKAFNSFLDMNIYLGATIGFLVVLLYITQGGFVAVVWSDVFQGTLMILGLVILPIVGLLELGGVTNLVDALRERAPEMLSITNGQGWNAGTITTALGFAAIGLGFLGSPQVFVRFISIRDEREINKGVWVAVIWTIVATSGAVLVGITGRALFDLDTLGGDRDNILPFMSQTLLPAFVAGVYIAMVLSAIMSTIDSLLVVASSAAVRDYWQRTRHPEMPDETLVRLSRRLTIALAGLAFAVGMGILAYDSERGVFWVIIFGWSGIAATFCPVMILSLFWSKLTVRAAALAMVTGFLCVPLFNFAMGPLLRAAGLDGVVEPLKNLDVLLPSFVISGAVAIVVSLFDRSGRASLVGVREDLIAAGSPPKRGGTA